MNLSKQTELRLFTEFNNNHEAIHENADLIDAHEKYAEETGGRAVCSVCFGIVNVWVIGDIAGLELKMPVQIITNKPVFTVQYGEFILNVVEK